MTPDAEAELLDYINACLFRGQWVSQGYIVE